MINDYHIDDGNWFKFKSQVSWCNFSGDNILQILAYTYHPGLFTKI